MGNLGKAIEKLFAPSIKKCFRLSYRTYRKRGAACESVEAELKYTSYSLLSMDISGCAATCSCHQNSVAFHEALRTYLSLSISEILKSENYVIRALGMLDARLSRRQLSRLNVKHEKSLVQELFIHRCRYEGVNIVQNPHAITAEKRQPKYEKNSFGSNPESRAEQLTQVMRKQKRRRDVSRVLHQLENGVDPAIADHPIVKIFAHHTVGKRSDKLESLKVLASKSKLVNERHLTGLLELLSDQVGRLGYVDSWKHRTHNADKQFGSLARHLFAEYDVPTFMDKAWLDGNPLHQTWFKHIGSGKNIRTAPDLPVPLTKMMAHHFLSAPQNYTVEQAIRRAQSLAAGADERMAHAIAQTRLSDDFRDNDFWLSVINFFARNPMLDTVQVGPIVDFIWNQKYVDVMEFVERGVAVSRGPAQPNFSMKGRTVASLLHQVERWHQALGKSTSTSGMIWARSSISEFELTEGSSESKNLRIWKISELLSGKELLTEGRVLEHCVASYASSCQRGACSIWSVTLQASALPQKVLTIEVRNQAKTIVQVRGKKNRLPTDREHQVIQQWATKVGLRYERR